MKTIHTLSLLAALSVPSVSSAQGLFDEVDTRLRYGLSLGGTLSRSLRSGEGTDTVDVSLDLGVQLNDRAAVFARGSAGWLFQSHRASATVMLEFTPIAQVSFAAGLGWDHFVDAAEANCARVDANAFTCGHRVWNGASVPLTVNLNFLTRGDGVARRRGVRLTLEGALGVDPSTGEVAGHAGVSVGYVAM